MAVGVERDVQDMLLGQRKTKRGQGNVPYPIEEYTTDLANLDIWDNMFFESIWGSPTIYNFPSEPGLVLDVGCGTGWWVINMARRWQNTMFVGFDLAEIQPRLRDFEHLNDISDRISWVNGNFLDVFPFPDDHFDYVRVCRAGLAVPEDEWQFFLEGIWRVMRTGGLLEIIEEDLIFPTPTIPGLSNEDSITPSPSRLDSHVTLDTLSSGSSGSTETYGPSTILGDDRSSKTKGKRSRLTSLKNSLASSRDARSSTDTLAAEGADTANHPQNHTKLKAAWDSMLTSRFISNKVLSILPFYLSTLFSGVEIFHLYTVPLPANTPLEYDIWDDDDSLYSFPRPRNRPHQQKHPVVNINPDHLINYPIVTELPRLQAMDLQELAGMHLHYTVGFIKSCKEAIREEYQKLYPTDDCRQSSPRVQRIMGTDVMGMVFQSAQPEPFDVEWNDWVW
ncbi:hypothetical protein D9756_003116 [Leucocoprinus leucothites]|uniref:Methyltransferase domain-containing protein n=1 Tax=Leucocoprinus leucothites TaxID=201217 RepID=A0A8H5LJ79_9AGAR|nr:hypothetical protein D9756_003116 [Leucoagaricus leucothites]